MAPNVKFKIGDFVMIKGGGHDWRNEYNKFIGDIYIVIDVDEDDSGYEILTLRDDSGRYDPYDSDLPRFYSDEIELITSDLDDIVFDADLLGLEDLL